MNFRCEECDLEITNKKDLIAHFWFKHRINGDKTILKFFYNNIIPKCKCGCGEDVRYSKHVQDYNIVINGHNVRFDETLRISKENAEKGIRIRKEKAAQGLYKGTASPELRKFRSDKIKLNNPSKGGHSDKTKKKISEARIEFNKEHPEVQERITKAAIEYWSKEENILRQRKNTTSRIMKKGKKPSMMEDDFAILLTEMGIEYTRQFELEWKLYDFWIHDTNILIETDGDFQHCNPKLYTKPKYEIQINSVENDLLKNEIAKRNGYILIRFWEYDIKNHIDKIIDQLLNIFK